MHRLSDMQLLVDTAEFGSLSAAGRRNGLSPAAASACLQRIETAVGARLFERTTRQLRLTEEGRIYVAYCHVALDAMGEAERAIHSGSEQVSGTLRVSAPSDLGRHMLLDILDDFMRRHPLLRVVLKLSDSLSRFVPDDIDVAVRVGPLEDSNLVARHLVDSRRVVCAAPELIARLGMPTTLDALAAMPALVLTTNAGPRDEWRVGAGTVRMRHYHECSDSEVIRTWAVRGLGVAYRQIWAVANDVAEGRLVLINASGWSAPSPIHALYHPNRFQPPRIRGFIDLLRNEMARRCVSSPLS